MRCGTRERRVMGLPLLVAQRMRACSQANSKETIYTKEPVSMI